MKPEPEPGNQIVVHILQLARGKGACEHDATAARLQTLDGREHLVLHLFFSLQEMHVFQQQQVHIPESVLETLRIAGAQSLHEAGRKFFGRQIFDFRIAAIAALTDGLSYGLCQVGLAQSWPGAEEKGIHHCIGPAQILGSSIGEVVGGTDHKAVEAVTPVMLSARHFDREGELFGARRKKSLPGSLLRLYGNFLPRTLGWGNA